MASHARATVLAPYTAPSSKTETKTALFRVSLKNIGEECARALGNKPVRKSPTRWYIQFLKAYVTIYGGRVGDRPLNSVPISLPPRGAFPPEGAFLLGTPLDFLSPGVPNVPRTSSCPAGVPVQLLSSREFPALRFRSLKRQRDPLPLAPSGPPHGCGDRLPDN